MSNRSSRDVPGSTVRELGLPARAVSALNRAGVDSVADLAALTRSELAGIAGLGPGSIAAIRAVVPEPSTGSGRAAQEQVQPPPEPVEEESPDAPAIPSFDSLRDPRRRTAFDLLVPEQPAAPAPAPPPAAAPASSPAPPPAPTRHAPPAEYGDLLRWAAHLAAAAVVVPLRVARWSVRASVRRLLGD
ncbi:MULTISPECIES: DNA-directed RNA polymerase subunit alpha C-terminal domain-containing protein [unclassified Modestobacter]|uniref:DNA-directed RNA polymerase subunit alpha C-terminal domain-containing protein n=1 Tax=unclassified Modestobacter TaxID=2643866 RepID=UPI0022AA9519|nr:MULTISPECIES: DNA-directed RNA polymerase subunit alpha C-terminal domain-containing protein [unclassified Modestobacter]MCZ2826227.1 hypothetical protein [Modestobacter sp. VKM Ac-2981]MCZ2852708.1 hypothetical protein [Modestobacter sp. VKM Ac-2982]